ncbi:hypothetical protein TUM18999_39720 [Pseudomonas tohonis]|uniref:Uncharacterized protein n=1 Tax=Pseudomonas tohonis TaxID=2725477 RepID=A0A6J4EB97_9PSED|nr:hypothetical protein TUM18999_39720 [Pseudomonas tohonis]GJN55358.1 hypothetical protein TUM20286_51100 [Pseudomonas tohonis]
MLMEILLGWGGAMDVPTPCRGRSRFRARTAKAARGLGLEVFHMGRCWRGSRGLLRGKQWGSRREGVVGAAR